MCSLSNLKSVTHDLVTFKSQYLFFKGLYGWDIFILGCISCGFLISFLKFRQNPCFFAFDKPKTWYFEISVDFWILMTQSFGNLFLNDFIEQRPFQLSWVFVTGERALTNFLHGFRCRNVCKNSKHSQIK